MVDSRLSHTKYFSHLLPPEKHHLSLHPIGHIYALSICPNNLCKCSLIPRCLFCFLWSLINSVSYNCITVWFAFVTSTDVTVVQNGKSDNGTELMSQMQWEAIKHDHSEVTQCNCSLQCRPIKKYVISLDTFWRSKNPVLASVMQFFIDFHQKPPRTIWQGPRRPLHKWPLLKSAPATATSISLVINAT